MVGSCCCCFGGKKSSSANVDSEVEEAVLLVSGIAGSIINAKRKKLFIEHQTRVWVRLSLADLEFRKNIWSLYNPQSGYTEPLDEGVEIVVPEDDHGLYAIDILDPSLLVKLFHLSEVYHFHDMINMLIDCGYKKGTTLFGYGYDFRQSNRISRAMDGLRDKLETAYKATGRKVNIISHSMGGLLVRCFMSLHNDVFSKYVNKWIAIACPFQGAPGCINDSLLTGLDFVEGFESFFFVKRWTMHQLLIECPSIYEMLPNPEFNWKKQPQIQVWRKKSGDTESCVKLESYGPKESPTLFEEALRNNELKFNGKNVPLPFNLSILKWADGTREVLTDAKLPSGISFYNIYGTSFDTPFDVSYGTESNPIEDLSEVCHSLPHYSFVDGDGTVPAESVKVELKADGFKAVERVAVVADHRGLLCDKKVFELLKKWLCVTNKVNNHLKCSKVMDMSL